MISSWHRKISEKKALQGEYYSSLLNCWLKHFLPIYLSFPNSFSYTYFPSLFIVVIRFHFLAVMTVIVAHLYFSPIRVFFFLKSVFFNEKSSWLQIENKISQSESYHLFQFCSMEEKVNTFGENVFFSEGDIFSRLAIMQG